MVKTLSSILSMILTNKAIVAAIIGMAERLAARTETKIDDKLVAQLKKQFLEEVESVTGDE